MAGKKSPQKKKKNISLKEGILHVHTTTNNTIITLTDLEGNKISGGWTWKVWFKGAKQNTPFASETLTKEILWEAKNFWLTHVWIVFKGVGMWREGVFKGINEEWLVSIQYITEKTWIQHGWCKGKRPKRN